jgi:hypothetical protein
MRESHRRNLDTHSKRHENENLDGQPVDLAFERRRVETRWREGRK